MAQPRHDSSELIRHPDGRIYHLNLLPHELAPTVLLVGDPGRVDQVSQCFEEVSVKQQNREFRTHTGTYQGSPLSVISTGIGPDNIDIVVNELDALGHLLPGSQSPDPPLRLIRIGTCGALPPNLAPGEPVVSQFAVGLDNIAHFYNLTVTDEEIALQKAVENHWASYGITLPCYVKQASPTLCERLSDCGTSGLTLTCPGFYGPQERGLRLKPSQAFVTALKDFYWKGMALQNLEMESSALFALATALDHEACTVALPLANRSTGAHMADHQSAMDHLIRQVLASLIPGKA